jgi:hypothetical protein
VGNVPTADMQFLHDCSFCNPSIPSNLTSTLKSANSDAIRMGVVGRRGSRDGHDLCRMFRMEKKEIA